MELALTAQDVAGLDSNQKDAVIAALVTAVIADGPPGADEMKTFDVALRTLPWGYSVEELSTKTRSVQARIAAGDRESKLAFLAEVAASITAPELREKVVLSMLAVVSADHDVTHGEKASVSAFIRVFGFTDAQIAAIRQKLRE